MKKIWNLPSYPVYSISTIDENDEPNMNICTYAVAVSMKPKLYMLAIYHNTKTLENIQKNKKCVLQFLTPEHNKFMTPFGRKSGMKSSKKNLILKHSTLLLSGFALLHGLAGYIELNVDSLSEVGGDHSIAICSVVESKTFSETEVLYWKM